MLVGAPGLLITGKVSSSEQFCMVLCGFVWFCVVFCGFLWFCVVLCGFVWFCVVLCLWMTLVHMSSKHFVCIKK